MIYFDNNATTPILPEVFDAMTPFLQGNFGNPSSAHAAGRNAKQAVENAREKVATMLGADSPDEIVFTSSGTESDNWAIEGALKAMSGGGHIVTTRVEHEAVRNLCKALEHRGWRVTWLDVNQDGMLDLGSLEKALLPDTAVVSVMLANNETGVLFPIADVARLVKSKCRALFHVDAVNAAGKVPIDVSEAEVDLLSISGHKFNGPKGIGALYVRSGVSLPSLLTGGGQEQGRRAGTEAVHQIVGIGKAAELAGEASVIQRTRSLRDRLESGILQAISQTYLNGTSDADKRLPNTSNISFENTNGEAIMAALDDAGICVSTGSACNSRDHSVSAVLSAMEVPYSRAMGAIRFSLGRTNTIEEVDHFLTLLPEIVGRIRSLAAAG